MVDFASHINIYIIYFYGCQLCHSCQRCLFFFLSDGQYCDNFDASVLGSMLTLSEIHKHIASFFIFRCLHSYTHHKYSTCF